MGSYFHVRFEKAQKNTDTPPLRNAALEQSTETTFSMINRNKKNLVKKYACPSEGHGHSIAGS